MNHFADKAAEYQQFRPRYPDDLFQYLISLTSFQDCAWDVGTGNGQAAIALSASFNKIFATDLKQGQLNVAEKKQNIRYIACPAEKTPIKNQSVDLITVAQALHWFNLDKFYEEVHRVAKLNAILAVWCYTLPEITPEIDALIHDLYSNILGNEYWPKERHYIDEKYQTIPFPFKKINTPAFNIERSLNFFQLEGYLNTWSALQQYKSENQNKNPLDFIRNDLRKIWGCPEKIYHTKTPIYLLAANINEDL